MQTSKETIVNQNVLSRRKVINTLGIGVGSLLTASNLPMALAAAAPSAVQTNALGRIGWFLSSEGIPAPMQVELGVKAEQAGLENIWLSDHFQPWQDNQGHSGYVRVTQAILGQRTKQVGISTSVTCPTYRYNPAEVAQAFATLSQFTPGRVLIGVGTGEALNETAATGKWGNYKERSERLIEAVTIMRQLWTGQTVTFDGKYYQVNQARLYDAPASEIPLLIAAAGPKSARLSGRYGDGLITVGGLIYKPGFREAFEAGAREAGRDPSSLPIIVEHNVVVGDESVAVKAAEKSRFSPWAWNPFVNNPNPVWIREQADANIPLKEVYKDWVISTDPLVHAAAIKKLWVAGVTHVQVHAQQEDQENAINFYGSKVLPLLK